MSHRSYNREGQDPRRGRTHHVWIPLAALAAILLAYPTCAAPTKEVRRILILNEANATYPAISIITQGIQAGLNDSPYHLEFYSEYMDTLLFPDPAVQQELHDAYVRKYQNRKLDLIITIGPSPLKFMEEVHQRAFPGVPIVFCLPNGTVLGSPALDSDFTGVENDMAPGKTIEIALRLQPGTKNVVVLGGMSPFDRKGLATVKEELKPFEGHVHISYLTDLAMPDLLRRVEHLPNHTLILLTSIGQDAAGNTYKANESGSLVVDAANAPVFSLFDVWLNHGEVGGYLSSFSEQGKVAGSMALRILRGEKAREIPTVQGVNTYMFDWRAVRRWGLKESAIPTGSIVVNRQLTAWESYKWYIIGGVVLILAETLLIFGLVWQRARAKRAETQLRESEERFRLLANTAPVMIWTAGIDRKCSYVNKTWLDFTGRTFEAELGDGWVDGVHPDDSKRCFETYAGAFNQRESFEMEYRVRRKDGEYRWVLDYGVPRFNPDGAFAGYIGSCIDITDRKLAEEGLATIGRRLIEAHEEERAWIGRELHDDINQRLALLANELEQWSQNTSTNEIIELVRYTQTRIIEVAHDVQGLSHRLHSSKLEYLGLATAAKSFCRELSEQAGIEIVFEHAGIPDNLPKEVSLCLFRVLQEGLQNAVKHSGVRSFAVDLQGTGESIDLTVTDFGKGFEEQDAFTGHGLGLISMRERLQLVHGELSVKSQPGAGSTIRARVPLEADAYGAIAGEALAG
ncbi:MAG: PAS domain S-box protein [Terriglobales bacterium]